MKKFIKFLRGLNPFLVVVTVQTIIIFIALISWKFALNIENSSLTAKVLYYVGEFFGAVVISCILTLIVNLLWFLSMIIINVILIIISLLKLTAISKIFDYTFDLQHKITRWFMGEYMYEAIFSY